MPLPEAQKAVEDLAKRVASLEQAVASSLIDDYAVVYSQLQAEASEIVAIAQRRELKPWQVGRMQRLQELEAQMVTRVNTFSRVAGSAVTEGQRAAVGLSVQGSPLTANAGLPRGITLDNLANIGIGWNQLPETAFEAFVGISGDGAPLGRLLAELGPQAAKATKEAIRTGLATGESPISIANAVRRQAGMPLTRALTISRTEVLRAHREATRLSYAANSNVVKGYRRLASKDSDTCMACIALDNTLYQTNQPLDSHPNCRCAIVPDVLSYKDLGLDIPDEPALQTGQQWFAGQGAATQKQMMGNKTFAAYQDGRIQLHDLVSTTTSPVWGQMSTVKSAKALGL